MPRTAVKTEELHDMIVGRRMTYSEVGAELGLSRSAVAGLAYRRGVSVVDWETQEATRKERQEPKGCRWIDGDVPGPKWTFCQCDRRPFSSYCDEHHQRVYQPRGSSKGAF